jgi:hypothetical protein
LAKTETLEHTALTGHEGRICVWQALFALWENGRLPLSLEEMERAFLGLPLDAEVLAVLLRLAARKNEDAFQRLAVPRGHAKTIRLSWWSIWPEPGGSAEWSHGLGPFIPPSTSRQGHVWTQGGGDPLSICLLGPGRYTRWI